MEKTLAAILERQNHPLSLIELNVPSLKPGQVLVKMCYSGLCRTQINEIIGLKGEDPYLPHTLGHEGSGVVLAIGEKVEKVKPQDHVVISWIKSKGEEVSSTQYEKENTKVNSGAVSTFLTYTIISENRLVSIPKDICLKEAALLGCAFCTGGGVIVNQMKLEEGNSLALFGLGGIGMSALLAASMQKAFPIIAIDIQEEKLQKAKKLGATHTIDASKEEVLSKIEEITEKQGVDFSLESAGSIQAMEQAFASLNSKKGVCYIAGNVKKKSTIRIDPFDLILGKRIYGTWGGGTDLDRDIPKYCRLIQEGKLSLKPLISHEAPLKKINSLIDLAKENKLQRALISFS